MVNSFIHQEPYYIGVDVAKDNQIDKDYSVALVFKRNDNSDTFEIVEQFSSRNKDNFEDKINEFKQKYFNNGKTPM